MSRRLAANDQSLVADRLSVMNSLKHIRRHALFGALSLFVFGNLTPAFAQTEPPLKPPKISPIATPLDAIIVYDWALYPELLTYALVDSNLYQSPTAPISAAGFRINPSLVAVLNNGIHKTTLYGNIDTQIYPSVRESNTFDRQAGFIQNYEALRDLTFRVQGDYTHKTNASALQDAIPGAITTPTPPGSPLPPGSARVNANGNIAINPYNQFTGTATVEKVFNRGFLKLSSSLSRTEYENQILAQDFSVATYSGTGAFWLGPAIFAYADGTEAVRATSSAYRVVGGLGSAQIGLFRGSAYVGHQGSKVDGSGTAGGIVYGGKLSYYPTRFWTVSASVDETVNISNQTASLLALNTASTLAAISIPTSASTRTTATALKSDYAISKLISTYAVLGYTRIEYVDSPQLDIAWLGSVGIKYDIWRNMTLTLDYQHTQIVSNAPGVSSVRDYVAFGNKYRF